MAWQADGFWKPEDVNVQNEVNKVAASDSPLMKQAAAKGQAKASARGLGNSSIAASAAQGEVLDRAIAIGGKQADILGATNNQQLQGQWSYKTGTTIQSMSDSAALERLREGNASEMARLDKQIAANSALAKQGDQAAMERLQLDLASRAQLQGVDIASRERIAQLSESGADRRLGLELTNRTDLAQLQESGANTRQTAELTNRTSLAQLQESGANTRQTAELTNRTDLAKLSESGANTRQTAELANRTSLAQLQESGANTRQTAELANRTSLAELQESGANTRQAADLQSRQILQNQELDAREKIFALEQQGLTTRQAQELVWKAGMQKAELDSAMDRAQLDATTRLNMGQMEIDANARNNALNAYVNLQSNYMTALSQSMVNPKLPAGVRASFQTSLKDVTNAGMDIIRSTTGTTLDWGNVPATPAPAPTPSTGLGRFV